VNHIVVYYILQCILQCILYVTMYIISNINQEEVIMTKYTYYIVDAEGYVLLTVVSQNTNRSYNDEAKFSVSPLLPVIAKQYGLNRVFWRE